MHASLSPLAVCSMNTTHHLLLDETQKNLHMEAIYRYQTQLNYVDDGIFPLLSYHHSLQEVIDARSSNVLVARRLT